MLVERPDVATRERKRSEGNVDMHRKDRNRASKLVKLGVLLCAGTVYQFAGCESAFIDLTRVFDPCGTVFANCAPGSFFANTVEIGSYEAHCFDPACTLPGQCGEIPLGATQNPCR